MYRSLVVVMAAGAFALGANAQSAVRAQIVGGGSNQGGKCTVEVLVDGAAEVEIRGDTGQIRNLGRSTCPVPPPPMHQSSSR